MRLLLMLLLLLILVGPTLGQVDLRSMGEQRDSKIIVELSKENDLLRRQLQVVAARCP